MEWLAKEAKRVHGLFFCIETICKCRVWLLYVNDPLRVAMIKVLHHGASLGYQTFKYWWMPSYTKKVG